MQKLLCQEELGYLGYRWLIWLALDIPRSNRCPMPSCAWTATGMNSSAHQRFCPHYTSLLPLQACKGPLCLWPHIWVPKLSSKLWSPKLAARRFFHIILLTLSPFCWWRVWLWGLSLTIYHLPESVMWPRGMSTKFVYSSLVSVHRMICSETTCVLSSSWLAKGVCACPSPCVKPHHFHSVALHKCPAHTDSATGAHEHRSHRAQGIQSCIIVTGQKCHSIF